MPMYYSKIKINYDPQFVNEKRYIYLYEDQLTLDILEKYISRDETFFICTLEPSMQGETYLIEIHRKRLETEEERQNRIAKEEKYNKNFEDFHAKRRDKKHN